MQGILAPSSSDFRDRHETLVPRLENRDHLEGRLPVLGQLLNEVNTAVGAASEAGLILIAASGTEHDHLAPLTPNRPPPSSRAAAQGSADSVNQA